MYQERMYGYYPKVIQSILEFNALIGAESPEFDELSNSVSIAIDDAYLLTMSEKRITQWERILGIRAVEGSTVEDRRATIIARIRGKGKLNTNLINSIVKTFTGAGCKAYIEDSKLQVQLFPSKYDKDYILDNLVQELALNVPAHLGLNVFKSWQYWNDVNNTWNSWNTVRELYGTWEDVVFNQTSKPNQLDVTKLDNFYLG